MKSMENKTLEELDNLENDYIATNRIWNSTTSPVRKLRQ